MKSSAETILAKDYGKKAIQLPNQRVSRSVKNGEKWQHDSVDFFINNRKNYYGNRKTKAEIDSNWDFYNNYLSPEELHHTLDPLGVEDKLYNEDIQNVFKFYNILDQPFDTLFGEELKRQVEIKAFAINPHIINSKDFEFKEKVSKFLTELAEQPGNINQELLQEKLKEFDKFRKNDLQSAHEKMANNIIQTLINDLSLNCKMVFNKGFKELEINSECIYRIGHAGKDLTLDKVQGANFYVLGMGSSNNIEDGYAWIEIDYMNSHKIIDEFAEELSNEEIDKILKLSVWDQDTMRPHRIALVDIDPDSKYATHALPLIEDKQFVSLDGRDAAEIDPDGNIRVHRVQWLSLRKLGKLKYFDQFGDEQFEWVDEFYQADVAQGEEVEWIWVNELWEGVRIGNSIYKKIRPCPVQMRSMTNPSIVRPSYVGYVMSNNGKVQKSRIEKLKPYQEMYNVWANKLVKLWSEHIGKVALFDVASIPSDMSTEEWYLWAKRFNFAFYNSFEEGKKGAAKGMIAGNMQQKSSVLDLGLAQEINQAIQTLSWIEERVNKISAIPEARQGAMSGREGLGVSQQSIVQSSHQTEMDFAIHDFVKSKVYEIMLEYAKVLWKDEKVKRQYVLDDLSNHILEIDGELLNEADYNVRITNSSQLMNMYNAITQLVHPAMQNGAQLSDIAKMYMATSPSQMVHQLEESEDKRNEQANEQSKMQQESMQAQMQAQKELAQIQHQQELEKINLEYQYKIQIEQMKMQHAFNIHSTDTNNNNIEDAVEIEKIAIGTTSAEKMQQDQIVADKEMLEIELQAKKDIEKIKITNKPKPVIKK
ncbi:MAG: hypothetical protein M0R17_04555 [Candidatus Omnitrophica bacterium]|jgi:hypothetical protein|nr:hypothetical protein [Candidatus Omnitrophota bacterium]